MPHNFARYLSSPEGEVIRDLKRNRDEVDTPEFADKGGELGRPAADFARKNPLQGFALPIVGSFIDKEAHRDGRFSSPYIAFKGSEGEQIQAVELDLAKMALPDMPREHPLAGVVRRSLGKLARAGDVAAADVEPIAGKTPLRDRCHRISLHKDTMSPDQRRGDLRLSANVIASLLSAPRQAWPDRAISKYSYPASATMMTDETRTEEGDRRNRDRRCYISTVTELARPEIAT
jgi:hypothetical protein